MGMQGKSGHPFDDGCNAQVGPVDAKNGTFPRETKVLCDPNDNSHLGQLTGIAMRDANGLIAAHKHYGNSWKKRGGVSAFMMLCRKWDRLEKFLEEQGYDIFKALDADTRGEGIIDDIRDLRRYLLLVEAEAAARGIECAQATHRDNIVETAAAAEQRYGGMPKPWSILRDGLEKRCTNLLVQAGGIILPQDGCPDAPVMQPPKDGLDEGKGLQDRRENDDKHAGRAVVLEDRDPGPSGSVSDPQGKDYPKDVEGWAG